MRVGIYNRYWTTQGGGERYAGTIAEALKTEAEVDVIGVEPLNLDDLGVHLDVDFRGTRFVRWPGLPCSRLTPFTRSYDVFVNATYWSSMRSEAKRSAYVVLFPHRLRPKLADSLRGWLDKLAGAVAPCRILPIGGCYGVEAGGLCWTSADAWLRVYPRAFEGRAATIRIRSDFAQGRILSVGGPIASWSAGSDHLRVAVDDPPKEPIEIHVRTEPFTPSDSGLSDDARQLGVCLDLGTDWGRFARSLANGAGSDSQGFLQDYDTLLAISTFTQRWVRQRWGRDSLVLPPPVDTDRFRPPPRHEKRQIVLSVGRFFAAQGGHNKKHIELLQTFRQMCDRGLVPVGWEFHLAGRVHRELPEHVAYFEHVQRLAEGYPVRILADLPYDRLVEEYRLASIFWHAAGWGEDDNLNPERFEHFGITTCEAMSAGCIPVVIGKAGQAEIVTDGVNGHTFLTAEELVRKTHGLMASFGTSHGAALAESARQTVERYRKPAFAAMARRVLLASSDRGPAGPADA